MAYILKQRVVFLPLANEVCEGYVFTGVCLSTLGGVRGFIWGWGVRGFIWGHVWFYLGGCVVLFGGSVHGFFGGCAWFFQFFRIQ